MEIDQQTRQDLKQHIQKTGTTTLGIVCKDGIVLAADRKISLGSGDRVVYIATKEEDKVVPVTDNILVSTAGNASDTQRIVKIIRSELRLKELRTKRKPSIKEAANIFANIVYQSIRQMSVIISITHFLLAGYDEKGYHLYEIGADGTLGMVDGYQATGSGMMQADPILDSEYQEGMSIEDGVQLARKCINASRKRDIASGKGLDVFVIQKDNIKKVLAQKVVSEMKDRD
jgi:proteasome beta subunit